MNNKVIIATKKVYNETQIECGIILKIGKFYYHKEFNYEESTKLTKSLPESINILEQQGYTVQRLFNQIDLVRYILG